MVCLLGSQSQRDGGKTLSLCCTSLKGDPISGIFKWKTRFNLLTRVISLFIRATSLLSQGHWFSFLVWQCNNHKFVQEVTSRSLWLLTGHVWFRTCPPSSIRAGVKPELLQHCRLSVSKENNIKKKQLLNMVALNTVKRQSTRTRRFTVHHLRYNIQRASATDLVSPTLFYKS